MKSKNRSFAVSVFKKYDMYVHHDQLLCTISRNEKSRDMVGVNHFKIISNARI